jgi:hypothetical protein
MVKLLIKINHNQTSPQNIKVRGISIKEITFKNTSFASLPLVNQIPASFTKFLVP